MQTLAEVIQGSIWARDLRPEQLERVRAETIERSIPTGAYACSRGEPVDHWVGVIDGLLKLSIGSPDGKMATLTGVPAGGWFGEGSLLRTEPRRYDAVALRDSRVALMPRATFYHLLDTSIGFNRFLLLQLNERLAQFIAMLEYERLLDPDARVARCLAWLFNPFLYPGIGQRLQVSQEEIGFLSGVSRQRVNQALHVLEASRLLRVEYGGVTVLDVDGLKRYGG
ncbi:MAG: Crp/Fnr family transcriptional regulator [Burkholderiales bacterium]|nr:Crp/Fnr family transcriptional regulator [Burkholderiales bacterium]